MRPHEETTRRAPGPSSVLSGRYELVTEIGRGGMGVVYRGVDRALGEAVAIKVLHPALELDTHGVERLKQETRIAHRLSHPNIVQLRHFEEDGSIRFVIMELVDGPSLRQVVTDRGRLPLAEVLQLAAGMCAGIAYAHSQGVVHCDVKPGNLLLAPDGTVKIADFGVARLARELAAAVTQVGLEGTFAFMSPEQLRRQAVDSRTDIYSLGVTLCALLNGEEFDADELRYRVLHGTLRDIPDVPDHVNRALRRALAEDRRRRWQTAEEFGEALRSPALAVFRRTMPLSLTSFFGREKEVALLERLLADEGRRLVTLTGPGGCGKSRLALEAGARLSGAFDGAVWFVPLEGLSDPQHIPEAVLAALELARTPGQTALQQAAEALTARRSLLVLDNFEHLVDEGASVIKQLLQQAPSLACLTTSRQLLGLSGEQEFALAPLLTPGRKDGLAKLEANPSVQLFVDRARAAQPAFTVNEENAQALAEVCRRLEGIPLALELAAARIRVMSPAQILSALKQRLDFLVSGKRDAAGRHRTLRAALGWSYRLLSPELGRFFACLSAFRGGWTADAAAAICAEPGALDSLTHLCECSLVVAEQRRGMVRFRMLDTLGEYADEQLSEEERAFCRRRHAAYFLSLAEGIRWDAPSLQSDRLELLDGEHENLRAAMDWFGSAEDGAQDGLRLAAALGSYWQAKGHWYEGREALARALSRAEAQERTPVRAHALSDAAGLASSQGDYDEARRLFEEALAIFRECGDLREVAAALGYLAGVHCREGAGPVARQLNQEALELCRRLGDEDGVARTQHSLALVAASEGHYAEARELLSESLKIRTSQGNNRKVTELVSDLGLVAMDEGRLEAARPLLEQSLTLRRELGDRDQIAIALHNLGALANARSDHDAAETLIAESMAISCELGHKALIAESLAAMAKVWRRRGRPRAAVRLLGASAALRESTGHAPLPSESDREPGECADLRQAIGDEAFTVAWQRGHSMSLEEAVQYALKPDDA